MFEAMAGWNEDRAFRYSSARLKAAHRQDRSRPAAALIDAKACVPADQVSGFIHGSLDHALNQAYRALKCLRDGDAAASRFEAAEAVNPFLDAAFALHGARLRPYYKYLDWELATYPLDKLPFAPGELRGRLISVLEAGSAGALCRLLAESEAAFRAAGHGAAYDGWERTLPWILCRSACDRSSCLRSSEPAWRGMVSNVGARFVSPRETRMAVADIRHEIVHTLALTEDAEREARAQLARGADGERVAAAGELDFLLRQRAEIKQRLAELDRRIAQRRTLFSWFRQQWFNVRLVFEHWIAHG